MIGKQQDTFGDSVGAGHGRILLICTATCEIYLRCQVDHSTMEKDWDLQAVPIPSLPSSHLRIYFEEL